MAISAPKRRKLRHSLDPNYPGIIEDAHSAGSSSNESPSLTETNGHSDRHGPRATLSDGAQGGPMGSADRTKRIPGPGSRREQLMAVNASGSPSLMTLQINDLLGEIRPDHELLMSCLAPTLQRLQKIILDLPGVGPMTAPEAEKSLRNEAAIYVPFPSPRPGKDTKYTFEYRRPAQMTVSGSLPLQIGIKSKDAFIVDIAITLPASILEDKDYLNHRYLHKRAYYIAQVAAGIKRNAKDEFKLSFHHQDGIAAKPTLIIEPTDSSPRGFLRSKSRVRIICAVNANAFAANRTMPTRSCLRNLEDASPTPFYNACIRSDATLDLYHKLLQRTVAESDTFRDVCCLGSLWLRQRGFGGSLQCGGFGPLEWSIVCALLLQGGGSGGRPALSPRYTCVQFFKAVLQFLASRDLTEPLLLNGATCELPRTETPVIFDGAAQINVLFKMTAWSYQLLRQEARSTMEAFSSKVIDGFDPTFIKRLDEDLLKYDQCLVLKAKALLRNQQERDDAQARLRKLHDVLSHGLGDRVRLVHLRYDSSQKWGIDKPFKHDAKCASLIKIGLLLKPDHVDRLVDHGPSAEDPVAAADFRKFWGDKAELRRFKDGSITESLVWSEESPATQQIVSYILQRHFDLPSSSLIFLGDQVERAVMTQNVALPPKSAFKLVNDAFQSLAKQLRQLEGLPLSIRSIMPASSQLRCASIPPPLTSLPTHPIDLIIEFEGSARWPDSLPAIQRTKIAFLIKLGDLLSASDPTITTRVGLETSTGPESEFSNLSFLDIILPCSSHHLLPPILFRLRIHHDRTLTLLQKALSSTETVSLRNRVSLTSTLQSFTRHYLATPNHTTTFSRLSTLYPTLSTAIALLKTWTASHYLSHSIPAEILEILAARPYLHPHPYTVPASAQTAFLRTLSFIASWDWVSEPLMVDFSSKDPGEGGGGLTPPALRNLEARFQAWRKQLDPALNSVVWFVGSNLDETGVVWTQGGRPQRVVAARFTALAKAAVELVRARTADADMEMEPNDWRELFRSPLADFDFLIHLTKPPKSLVGPAAATGRASPFKNLQLQSLLPLLPPATAAAGPDDEATPPRTGFDPVSLYLHDLERCFGPDVLFFHGGAAQGVIAGLWHPTVLPPNNNNNNNNNNHSRSRGKEWRVKMGYSTIPIVAVPGDDDSLGPKGQEKAMMMMTTERVEGVVNRRGILAEIALLGDGLVERVEVVKEGGGGGGGGGGGTDLVSCRIEKRK